MLPHSAWAGSRGTRVISSRVWAHRLVGRGRERAFFDERLAQAVQGRGSVLLLLGEAGVGKTRLLREWVTSASQRGFLCSIGENFEHAAEAFATIAQALGALLERAPEAMPTSPAAAKLLERLVAQSQPGDSLEADGQPWQKRRLFVVTGDLLQRASELHPVLLCIDDAQWADPESLELLVYLASRIEDRRAIIAVSARTPRASDDGLAAALGALERVQWCHRILLGPLSETETRELIRAALGPERHLPARTVDEICRRSEGLPLFAEGLLREALHAPNSAPSLPISVAQATGRQLSALQPQDAAGIEVGAVLGLAFETEAFVRVSALTEGDATRALRGARDVGLLTSDESGRLRFTHQLVRDAVYERLLPTQRRALHRRIAELLEASRDASPATLAHHWKAAGDDSRAASYAVTAGEEALRRYAFASARDQFEAALTSQTLVQAERAAVLRQLGTAYNLLGDAAEAYRRYDGALRLYRELGDRKKALQVLLLLTIAAQRKYDSEATLRHSREALAEAEPGSADAFMANASIAFHLTMEVEIEAAEPYLEAAERFTGERDGTYVVRLLQSRAVAAFYRGRYDEWRVAADAAVTAAEEQGDPTPIVFSLLNMGVLACEIGLFDVAIEWAERVRAIADEYGLAYHSALARLELSEIALLRGDLAGARQALQATRAFAVDANVFRFRSCYVGIRLGLLLGDAALADEYASVQTLEDAFASGSVGSLGTLGAAHADLASQRKDRRAAEKLVGRILAAADSAQWLVEELPTYLRSAADEDLPRIVWLLTKHRETPSSRAARLLAEAMLAGRQGKRSRMRALATEAVAAARRIGRPLHEAHALEVFGDHEAALAIYERLGAAGEVARLDAAGRRSKHGAALTKREREIARLVCDGKSNRDIADCLRISVRTVEHHVASIFAKRSVRSRADL
jgi:DNA-binding CsgD family transcriptional regulator